ncbi:hypothetical protein RFI_30137, partial [Reticulomyxa filosa]
DDALKQPDLDERKQLLELFKQDLEYTESEFKPKKRHERRHIQHIQEQRYNNKKIIYIYIHKEGRVVPLTETQQAFIQESLLRDQELDKKLDQIGSGLKVIQEMAREINDELGKQEFMITEIGGKMETLQSKIQTRNEQIKKLLKSVLFCLLLFFF